MLRLSVGVAYGSPYKYFIFFLLFFYCIFIVLLLATLPMLRLSVGPSAPTLYCPLPFKLIPTLLLATTPYDSPKVPPSYS
jgi:hypothetical protein